MLDEGNEMKKLVKVATSTTIAEQSLLCAICTTFLLMLFLDFCIMIQSTFFDMFVCLAVFSI